MESASAETNTQPLTEEKKKPKSLIPAFMLQTWSPSFTWRSTVLFYLAIGCLTFLYGLIITACNATITEIIVEYDHICKDEATCTVSITVPADMEQPIYLYYGLKDFYQNHRLFLISKSVTQLAGTNIDLAEAKANCGGAVYNKDMNRTMSWGNVPLVQDAIASPCGLIAKAFFTDEYTLTSSIQGSQNIKLHRSDIAWPKGIGKIFKRTPDSEKTQWIDPEREDFMVWMRTSVFSDGRKLYARIEDDIPSGEYFMKINNKYNATAFNGKKYFVLTTANIFGGKVEFLASTFIVIGMVFMLLSLFFFNRSKETKRVPFNVRGVTN